MAFHERDGRGCAARSHREARSSRPESRLVVGPAIWGFGPMPACPPAPAPSGLPSRVPDAGLLGRASQVHQRLGLHFRHDPTTMDLEVFSAVPRSPATCVFSMPVTTSPSTWHSRGVEAIVGDTRVAPSRRHALEDLEQIEIERDAPLGQPVPALPPVAGEPGPRPQVVRVTRGRIGLRDRQHRPGDEGREAEEHRAPCTGRFSPSGMLAHTPASCQCFLRFAPASRWHPTCVAVYSLPGSRPCPKI